MGMDAAMFEALIRSALPEATVRVEDLRGDGSHFAATVIAPQFSGLSRLQQHRMVYAALEGHVGGDLHALQLTTRAEDVA